MTIKSPLVDRRHLDFLLYEVFHVESLTKYPRFAGHSRDTFDAAITLAHDVALDRFLPHNRLADLNEPRMGPDGKVVLIPEIKAALDAYAAAGFMAISADEDVGGIQLPVTIATACDGMFMAANVATAGYTLLARGVAELIDAFGTPDQKRLYMRPILEGRYLGTMCLSEPQAGSSLADITLAAHPQPDGTYRLTGAKMWISGGEHELSENIVHLVLGRIPGGPPGVKGLSLFIVPRLLVGSDGTPGEPNDVVLAGLNHKMGHRGIVNTFLRFGEQGRCVGSLVGQPHQGLACMFHMMNGARIGVGLGAVMLGYAGYLYSLKYAQERHQGRLVDERDPTTPPVRIIEHADVRRMLMQQKAWVEAAYALAIYSGWLVDRERQDPDPQVRRESRLLLELLTPIVKAWSAEWMLAANDRAIQVLGGYGYTRDYPVEQYYRDNRLNPIHEGTNGIQAIDLLGRKLMMENGAAVRALAAAVRGAIGRARAHRTLEPLAGTLERYLAMATDVVSVVGSALRQGRARLALSHAHEALTCFGHLVMAWMWVEQAISAVAGGTRGAATDADFYAGKLAAARWFFDHELPLAELSALALTSMDPVLVELRTEWF